MGDPHQQQAAVEKVEICVKPQMGYEVAGCFFLQTEGCVPYHSHSAQ